LEFGILGPLLVVGPDGSVEVRGTKRRGLLAYLLVHAGEAVPLDRLVEDLWDERSAAGARGTVQSYLSQMRKLLRDSSGVTLETRPSGYALDVPAHSLDAARFERLCARAATETDATKRLTLVDEALGLWRGEPLGEFAGSTWADVEATRLEALRLQALQQRIDARLELGHHAEAVPELERLVGDHPLHEHFWAQLMAAYYRSGRQADALRACQRVRSLLAEELGVEPSAELQELERRILDHDPDLMLSQPTPASTADPLPEGVVTFLLTDIEGSTSLWDADPDAMSRAIARYEELIAQTVAVHRGRIVKSRGEGDSTLSVFERASDAAIAAVALQRGLVNEGWPGGLRLPTRVAMHTGEAHLRDGDYYGGPLNRAARIRAVAAAGQILCSRPTRDLVADTLADEVRVIELGTHALKGLQRPETIFALVHPELAEVAPLALPTATTEPFTVPLPVRLTATDAPFVAREQERTLLDAALKSVRSEMRRRVVVIAGEPGIGKTTLTAHFARSAHHDGVTVLAGHCDEDLAIPYQPWTEALGHLVRHAPDSLLQAHVGARGGELTRLVPDLARRAYCPTPPTRDPEAERYLLFGAVVDLLERASQETPCVLVLDDLHWADRPTLELLRHMIGAEASLQLLVVMIHRDTDVPDDHPIVETLAALRREPGVERTELGGFDVDALGELLEVSAGHGLDAEGLALRDTLAAETDGNPFFVTEVLRHLDETGAIRQADDGGWIASNPQGPLGLPTSVREVITHRVARLGDHARKILTLAAVIGHEFELDVLAEIAESDETVLLDTVDAATRSALVRPTGDDAERYAFVHALIEHTLSDALSPPRRRRAHAHIADALERRYGDDPGGRITELAHHYLRAATEPDKAIDYASRAGAHALACLAPGEALRWYRQALELLERSAQPDDHRRGALLVGVGDAQRQIGDATHRETLLDAAALARRLDDADLLVRAVIANSRGMLSSATEPDTDRIAALEAARAATEQEATRERALVLATLAAEISFTDRPRMRRLADEAISLAHRLGDDPTLVIVTTRMEAAVRAPDNLMQRCALADEAIAAAERTGDPVLRWYAATMNYTPALESGAIEAFHRRLDVVQLLAHEIGQPHMRYVAAFAQSLREALAGSLDDAEQTAALALEIGANCGQPDAFLVYGLQLIAIRHYQGRLNELMESTERSAAENPGMPAFRPVLADCYREVGRIADARALVAADAAEDFRSLPVDSFWTTALTIYSRVAASACNERAASRLIELLDPWRDQVATTGATVSGSLAHPLGLVLATTGRLDDAEEAITRAAAVNERLGAPILLADTRLEYARLLWRRDRRGDRSRARELAESARTVAAELGAASIARQAAELVG
jgi:DNA-binding SARP family transcriptional activator/energy-coupling factor transporter ATP-binding protein EcfA2